jgi:hypothetical protein
LPRSDVPLGDGERTDESAFKVVVQATLVHNQKNGPTRSGPEWALLGSNQ